ncbi:MAG: hypothetical protein QXL16_01620, partial [Candidatus Micrarchaeaceae archaeon]
ASLSNVNGTTNLVVYVRNDGNSTVTLKHVLLFGNFSTKINFIVNSSNLTEGQNASGRLVIRSPPLFYFNFSNGIFSFKFNATEAEKYSREGYENLIRLINSSGAIQINGSIFSNVNASDLEKLNFSQFKSILANLTNNTSISGLIKEKMNGTDAEKEFEHIKGAGEVDIELEHTKVLNFLVESNGTLALPFSTEDFENDSGIQVAPHSTVKLAFSSPISFGHGLLLVFPEKGSVYRIVISGEESARASANVTAS